MLKKIATETLTLAGGVYITPSQSVVRANGKLVIVDDDSVLPHTIGDSTHEGKVLASSSVVFVCGKAIARIDDSANCGETLSVGDRTVSAG